MSCSILIIACFGCRPSHPTLLWVFMRVISCDSQGFIGSPILSRTFYIWTPPYHAAFFIWYMLRGFGLLLGFHLFVGILLSTRFHVFSSSPGLGALFGDLSGFSFVRVPPCVFRMFPVRVGLLFGIFEFCLFVIIGWYHFWNPFSWVFQNFFATLVFVFLWIFSFVSSPLVMF